MEEAGVGGDLQGREPSTRGQRGDEDFLYFLYLKHIDIIPI